MKHNELINLTVEVLRTDSRIVLPNLILGSMYVNYSSVPHADIFSTDKSFTRPWYKIYEIKVSRSDFYSDVRSRKYMSYFPYCEELYFVAPKGLLRKDEIPEGCGLMIYNLDKKSLTTVRRAPVRECVLSEEVMRSIMLQNYSKNVQVDRREYNLKLAFNAHHKQDALNIGKDVRDKLRLVETCEEQIARAKEDIAGSFGLEIGEDESLWLLCSRAVKTRGLTELENNILDLAISCLRCLGNNKLPYDFHKTLKKIEGTVSLLDEEDDER